MIKIIVIIIFRLNCNFNSLTFTKLRFWPLRKKLQNGPPKFCIYSSFGPQGQKKIKIITCGTSLRVLRQRRPSQNWHWGSKLPQMQNLGSCFVVFFLGGQNRNFVKVRGLKLQLSLIFIREYYFA